MTETPFDKLAEAWQDLWLELVKAWKIDRLAEWLNRKLTK